MASIISAGTTSGTSLNLSGDTSGVLQLATNGSTTAVTIDTSQRVGIGTTTLNDTLTLYAASNTFQRWQAAVTGTASSDGFQIGIGSVGEAYVWQYESQPIIYATTNTERMRIDSSGNVGIGTSSPGSFNAFANQLVVGNGSSSQGITVFASGASSISFADGTAGTAPFQGYIQYNHAIDAMDFYVNYAGSTSPRMRINSNGGIQAANSISVGNVTPTTSGAGITFPATQSASSDANTLDDYEEGTWSPVVQGSSTAGTASYSVQNARYTKIGRMVQFEFYLNWSSGNGSGNLLIGGLPFANNAASTYPSYAIGYWDGISISANTVPMCFSGNGATTISFIVMLSGGSGIGTVGYDGAGAIQVSGCYTV